MAKDPFAQYKLPIGLTDGVDIPLAGTPAVFRVRLPGTMNEDFNMQLMSRLQTNVDEDGSVRVDAVKFQRERKDMFFDTCILSASGLPDGMDAAAFFEAYPLAARTVLDKATELAEIADKEASDALGKLESSPSGKPSGEGSMTNTSNSSKAA